MMDGPVLETDRFILRPLGLSDVNERYLSWFSGADAENISAQKTTHTLQDLRTYVADKVGRPDVAFLAVIDQATQRHIGNIKYEPVDRETGHAVLGIFIGDEAFRGKGVAVEVITASGRWLKGLGIREIVLGVDVENVAAIGAYEKAGFRIGSTPHLPVLDRVHRMILTL